MNYKWKQKTKTDEPVCANLQGDNICIGLFQSNG